MSTVAPDNPTSLEVFSLPNGDYLVTQEPGGLATAVAVQTHQFVTNVENTHVFASYRRLPHENETLQDWQHDSGAVERQGPQRRWSVTPELSLRFSPGLLESQQKEREEVARVFGGCALNVMANPAAPITLVGDLKELGVPLSSARVQYALGSLIP